MPTAISQEKIDLSSENRAKDLANKFLKRLKVGDIIFLYGEMGVGKTTFIKYLINAFQKKNNLKLSEITSPTFNLLHEYDIKDLQIMHYDLYRIRESEELNHLGIFTDSTNSIKIIEWPDLIKTPLEDKLEIYLNYCKNENEREMKIVGFGKWKKFENEL